jgi:hypothetical protein
MGAMGAYNQAQQEQRRNELVKIQQQMAQMQLEREREAAGDRRQVRDFYAGASKYANPGSPGVNPSEMDPEGAPAMPPSFNTQAFARDMMNIPALAPQGLQMLMPQKEEEYTLTPGAARFRGGREIARAPVEPKDNTTDDVREYMFAKREGYPGTFEQWLIASKKAGANNISLNAGDRSFGDAFGKNAAEALDASRKSAQAAADSLTTIGRMKGALAKGVVAGPGSQFRRFGLQIGQVLGVSGKDAEEKLKNTRTLIQGTSSLALSGAKALEGQGSVTENERRLVERASSGDIDSMTDAELGVLLGVLERVHGSTISRHQGLLKNVGPQFQPFMPFYQVDAPNAGSDTPTVVDFNSLPQRKP